MWGEGYGVGCAEGCVGCVVRFRGMYDLRLRDARDEGYQGCEESGMRRIRDVKI